MSLKFIKINNRREKYINYNIIMKSEIVMAVKESFKQV